MRNTRLGISYGLKVTQSCDLIAGSLHMMLNQGAEPSLIHEKDSVDDEGLVTCGRQESSLQSSFPLQATQTYISRIQSVVVVVVGLVEKLCLTLLTPWTVACQAPLSVGFPRQEYGVGCCLLLQGIIWTQGLNPGLLHDRQSFALQVDSLPTEPPGKPHTRIKYE